MDSHLYTAPYPQQAPVDSFTSALPVYVSHHDVRATFVAPSYPNTTYADYIEAPNAPQGWALQSVAMPPPATTTPWIEQSQACAADVATQPR